VSFRAGGAERPSRRPSRAAGFKPRRERWGKLIDPGHPGAAIFLGKLSAIGSQPPAQDGGPAFHER